VVKQGVVASPPTSFQVTGWEKYPIARIISQASGCPTTVINDGDAASLAEMRFGAGRDQMGVVMMFTLGTGIGTALFVNGHMVPNLELGHLYLPNKKKDAEYQTAERIRQEEKLSWRQWGQRLNTYFNHIERLFSPDLIIIGGGISKKHEKFLHYINVRARVVPAELQNEAGIIGAAMAAIEVRADKALYLGI
jgi:polyphosphate glucokinase